MDEGDGLFPEATQCRRDLSGQVPEQGPLLRRELGPPQKARKVSADLVGTHVVMAGQVLRFSESGRIPKPGVDAGNAPGGGGELRPGQTAELVTVPTLANLLQEKKAVRSIRDGRARKQARGQFSLKGDEEPVGGQFTGKGVEFSGPLPPFRDIAADLEDVAPGIALPCGHENAAEKTGGASEGPDEETGGARRKPIFHGLRNLQDLAGADDGVGGELVERAELIGSGLNAPGFELPADPGESVTGTDGVGARGIRFGGRV